MVSNGRKTSNRPQKAPKRMIYILLGLAFVIIASLCSAYPYVITSTQEIAVIKIPANASNKNVSDTLTKYYGEAFAGRVMRIAALRKVDFSRRHGAYEIDPGANAIAVARRISSGAQTPVRITINGFRSLDLLTERVSSKLDFTADQLRAELNNPETLSPYGLTPDNAMALFVDDSYDLYWSATPREFIDKIGRNYLTLWNEERRSKATELNLSPSDIMIIASIVDEETNALSEKGTIGQLYINRLRKGMALQSDPTVRFALNDFTIKRVKGNHLQVDSPYNTYRNKGLPPGPIRTTGKATVDAILNSPANDYLYMCAKEDFSGTHNFAVTFSEHTENAKRYRNALDTLGIN